ncbi:unnamed protein product [[Candida] boidinii]|nr:unnamed protein product [[Candida] boidinii]
MFTHQIQLPRVAAGLTRSRMIMFKRLQSSSSDPNIKASAIINSAQKKKLALLEKQRSQTNKEQQQQQQQQKQKQQQQQQTQLQSNQTLKTASTLKKTVPLVKPRIGFTSLPKVPSTISLKPKEVLLDKLFSGYRPITLPIQPPSKSPLKTNAVVYFELDENLDLLDDSGFTSTKDASINEDKNRTRYEISNYSFSHDDFENDDLNTLLYNKNNSKKNKNIKNSSYSMKSLEKKFKERKVNRTGRKRYNYTKSQDSDSNNDSNA